MLSLKWNFLNYIVSLNIHGDILGLDYFGVPLHFGVTVQNIFRTEKNMCRKYH